MSGAASSTASGTTPSAVSGERRREAAALTGSAKLYRSSVGTKDLPKCVGSAPFEKVRKDTGDFTVVPWNPNF